MNFALVGISMAISGVNIALHASGANEIAVRPPMRSNCTTAEELHSKDPGFAPPRFSHRNKSEWDAGTKAMQ
jgi:hypothetical protein